MIRLRRPRKPTEFDEAVNGLIDGIETEINNNDGSVEFDEVWGGFKDRFFEAQKGKCAYCELPVAGQNGDVEHYRPKGRIQQLRAHGRELPHSSKVRDRKMEVEQETGYWWLAYSWDNYLLSCLACNQKWKRDLFPVEGIRAIPKEKKDAALLLNPFHRRDPVNHLDYDVDGGIAPWNSSKYGRNTIDTCGLARPSLTLERREKAGRAYRLAQELIAATRSGSDEEFERAMRDVYDAGKTGHQFAGVVRAIIKHTCGIDWSTVEDFVGS